LIVDAVGGRFAAGGGGGDHSPAASGPEREVSVGGGGSRAEGTGLSPLSVSGPPAEDVGFKGTVSWDGHLVSTVLPEYALMVFKVFFKSFSPPYIIIICFFEITYQFWKCLLKSTSEFSPLWLVDVL
jgi:hypothetical protein